MAQSFHALEPTELVGLTSGSWQTKDVSSVVPEGATGIILRIDNTGSSSNRNVGLRKPGDTEHTENYAVPALDHTGGFCGVNADREFQYYLGSTTCKLDLLGYTTDGVTFKNAAIDISSSLNVGQWTDVDCTIDTSSDAIAIILEIGGNSTGAGARCYGSSDEGFDFSLNYHCWGIVKCDSSQKIEVRVSNSNHKVYILGYVTDGLEGLEVTQPDKSLDTKNSWQTITVDPSALVAIFRVYAGYTERSFGFRKDSDAPEYYGVVYSRLAWYAVECDANGNCLGKISATDVDFYLVGYATSGIKDKTVSDSGVGTDELKAGELFEKELTGLTGATKYYYRAKTHSASEGGWVYGEEKEFTTVGEAITISDSGTGYECDPPGMEASFTEDDYSNYPPEFGGDPNWEGEYTE